jgi:hypothetical protein
VSPDLVAVAQTQAGAKGMIQQQTASYISC